MSEIIRPGQPRGVSGAEAINLIIKQMQGFAMEINLINVRIQVLQNVLIAKGQFTEPELEAEWQKVMTEARDVAARATLVSPDGQRIMPSDPARQQAAGPEGASAAEGPTGPTGDYQMPQSLIKPGVGHA